MDWITLVQSSSIVGVLFAVTFGFSTWLRNKTKDGSDTMTLIVKMESMSEDFKEMKRDIKDIWQDNKTFREVQIRDSVRIDSLENRVMNLETQVNGGISNESSK